MIFEADFRDRWQHLGWLPVYFILSHAVLAQPVAADEILFQSTVADYYEVRFDSQPKPIVINQIQSWVMYLQTLEFLLKEKLRSLEGEVVPRILTVPLCVIYP